MESKYKVGTISKLLAKKSKGKESSHDPKLAALFSGGNVSKVFKTAKVTESQIFKKKVEASPADADTEAKGKKRKRNDKDGVDSVKLSNKDAAGIRVNVRRAVHTEEVKAKEPLQTTGLSNQGEKKTVKDIKKLKRVRQGQETETTASSAEAVPGESRRERKKAKKWKLVNDDAAVVSPKKSNVDETNENFEKSGPVPTKNKKKEKRLKNRKQEQGDTDKVSNKNELADDEGDAEQNSAQKSIAERNAPKQKDSALEARTIFVGNLPGDIDQKKLKKIFKAFGTIETVRIRGAAPSKPTTLKKVAVYRKELHPDNNTLAAYIRFVSIEEAKNAVDKARGLMIKENHIVVDMAEAEKKDNKKAIFVGNLNLKMKDEELWQFFQDCGAIVSVRIIRDNATGMGKGFGYVNFEDKDSVQSALKKNQEEFHNRTIRISRCVKKVKVKKEKKSFANRGGKNIAVKGGKVEARKPQKSGGKGPWKKSVKPDNTTRPERNKNAYSGDKLSEIGKLKRKSNKPNKGEMRKAKIAKLLIKTNQKQPNPSRLNKKNKINKR